MGNIGLTHWEAAMLRISRIIFVAGLCLSIGGGLLMFFTPPETNATPPIYAAPASKPVQFSLNEALHKPRPAVMEQFKATPSPHRPILVGACLACSPPISLITVEAHITPKQQATIARLMLPKLWNRPTPTVQSPFAESVAPLVTATGCPTTSTAQFATIPVERSNFDHPDRAHADLNLDLRGYEATSVALERVPYDGQVDSDPPQLAGLFRPRRMATLSAAYQLHEWQWDCSANSHGCRAEVITMWPTTLIGLATTPGESLYPPNRQADLYQGYYKVVVLYADAHQITLGYTRRDSVVGGYTIHVEGICVDANLLTLYQAQQDEAGWRQTNRLPALADDQSFGIAAESELRIAVRDNGMFMDPRSNKDWWQW